MAVPFAKLQAAVTQDRKDRETRDVLGKLAKALIGGSAYKVMRDFDSRTADMPSADVGTVFMSCIAENPLKADLYIDTGQPVSIITLFRGDFTKGELLRILRKFASSNAKGCEAVIVFKVKHLGVWVAYNTADPYPMSIPRIVVPSNNPGQSAITIMPLTAYTKMWNTKRGETE